jgi:hypothetical protein
MAAKIDKASTKYKYMESKAWYKASIYASNWAMINIVMTEFTHTHMQP